MGVWQHVHHALNSGVCAASAQRQACVPAFQSAVNYDTYVAAAEEKNVVAA
jgi:hypothetical protein